VSEKNKESVKHSFNAYYEESPLVVQFILAEFLQTNKSLLNLKNLLNENENLGQLSDVDIIKLNQSFAELVGTLNPQENFTFPNWSKGSLSKLKEYCEQLSKNTKFKPHIDLHLAVNQAWLTALQNIELLNALQSNEGISNLSFLLISLKRSINSLQVRFQQIIRLLPKIYPPFWENENVILFLLRKKSELCEIYGPDFLDKIFHCPHDPRQLLELLIRRYHARGFDTLPPKILSLLTNESVTHETL
jgi:hypothetical protein